MEALECIYSKRETREFLDRAVPYGVIKQVLEAGRLAGSAKNRQPWNFVLVQEKKRLKELASFGQSTSHLPNAAFAVVIVRKNEYFQDPFDAGRAAQNMMLMAHALGLGSCPVTLHNQEGARRFIGAPENLVVQVCLAFGYPAPRPRGGKLMRKPLEDVLHSEKW